MTDHLKEAMKWNLIFASNMGCIGPIRMEMESENSHVCTVGRTTWESGCDSRLR